jgi:nitrous oxide reductase accessory protein NosL
MKKLFIITFLSLFLNASQWCPVTGLKISDHIETSYQAKLKSNNSLRVYASLYALLQDRKNYGLKDIKKYDIKTKTYIDIEIPDTLHVEKNPMSEVYKKRYYPMGKKLYKKRCPQDIDLDDFFEIGDLKEELKEICNLDSEVYLQATAVYLWDVKRVGGIVFNKRKIHVEKDEKCPVCGMYVYKYPRWAAQIFYKDKHYSFDGVKDMMKWYFKHKDGIKEIKVSDYYSQHAIDAKKAYFVIGSDTYGPMGYELIPFLELNDAKDFMSDHKGKKIFKFDEISPELSLFME